MVRGDQPEEEVFDVLNSSLGRGVPFSDRDLFQLITELVRAKKRDAAQKVLDILPKKRGFWQEMRNHCPELIRLGEYEYAYELFNGSKVPQKGGATGSDAIMTTGDAGLIFYECLIRNDVPADKLMEFFKRTDFGGEKETDMVACKLMTIYLDANKMEQGVLARKALNKERPNFLNRGFKDINFWFVGKCIREIHTKEQAQQLTDNMFKLDVLPLTTTWATNMMPLILEGYRNPGEALRQFGAPVGFINNAAIIYLLNQEKIEDFESAARFATIRRVQCRSHLFSSSLARSYLATENMEFLLAIIAQSSAFIGRHMAARPSGSEVPKNHGQKDQDIFNVLCHMHNLLAG